MSGDERPPSTASTNAAALIVALPRVEPPPLGSVERAILMAIERDAQTADFYGTTTIVVPLDSLRAILARSSELRGVGR